MLAPSLWPPTVLPDGDDLLRGLRRIADFVGEPERRVRQLVRQGDLPAVEIVAISADAGLAERLHVANLPKGRGRWNGRCASVRRKSEMHKPLNVGSGKTETPT